MMNSGRKPQEAERSNSLIPSSRTISRIVSSVASNVASTVRSAASAIVEKDADAINNQVFWAGFDKLECDGNSTCKILFLCYGLGFQIWDVEEATYVHEIASRNDIRVSFLQMSPKPLWSDDIFSVSRPLLVAAVCANDSSYGGRDMQHDITSMSLQGHSGAGFVSTSVYFYPWKSKSHVHALKFRSAVYSVRCSSRIVAVLLAAEIHCFSAGTLEREYNILTNRITPSPGSVTVGLGPLAVGPRWIAYSGLHVSVSGSGRISPQHLTQSASFSNTSELVTHYAKESTKQLVTGIATLGDIGYKKLSRYYSDIPNAYNRDRGSTNSPSNLAPDTDNDGMVVVRDIVSKSVIAQFRAHKSPIFSLCFSPSGTLLVTASNHGNNINVFRIMRTDTGPASSYEQVYTLHRGRTKAVIQDVSFSDDSHWIMTSSTRTSHLFAMPVIQHNQSSHPPVTLFKISKIRSSNGGSKGSVAGMAVAASGMAAAATGNTSLFTSPIASTFLNCLNRGFGDAKYNLLVYSHPSCVMQHAIKDLDSGILVEPIRQWTIDLKRIRSERADIYSDTENIKSQHSGNTLPEVGARVLENIKSQHSGNTLPEVGARVLENTNERHQEFMSLAEFNMHEPWVPLWGKHGISFQSMITDNIDIDKEMALGGEIEIEEIPVRTIQSRRKDLVPVFGYYTDPQLQQPRSTGRDVTGSETHVFGESSHGKTVNKNDHKVKTVNSDNREGTQSMSVDSNIGSKMADEGDDDESD